jgi:hypothetical protein
MLIVGRPPADVALGPLPLARIIGPPTRGAADAALLIGWDLRLAPAVVDAAPAIVSAKPPAAMRVATRFIGIMVLLR